MIDPDVMDVKRFASLLRAAGIHRDEIADEQGLGSEDFVTVVLQGPCVIPKENDKNLIVVPDIHHPELLTGDHWLEVLAELEALEKDSPGEGSKL